MPSTFYPSGQITPRGARKLLEGEEPIITWRSWNDEIVFNMMGAFAPMPGVQNGVVIDSPKNLMPNWHFQDQQGANTDGVITIGSVLDPIECTMIAEAHGNTPRECQRVVRDWLESWHRDKRGELSVITPDMGHWWAKARWHKSPDDVLTKVASASQRFVWRFRIDEGCWRSYDSVSSFGFVYEDMTETFSLDTSHWVGHGLGPNWPLYYSGTGGGYIYSDNGQARWKDEGGLFTDHREVVCGPYKDFETSTDNQIVNMVFGSIPEISLVRGGADDLWARMGRNEDGTWNGNGVRVRVGALTASMSIFVNFVETKVRSKILPIITVFGEKFTLICGDDDRPYWFQLQRNGHPVFEYEDTAHLSVMDSDHRGIGFGMLAFGALISQATPANVRKISAGDYAAASQSGTLYLSNIGDFDEWYRLTLWGPGTFWFGNGSDSSKRIKFGQLNAGQVVHLRTDPHRRGVVDYSSIQPTTSELAELKASITQLSSLAANGNVAPLLAQFESAFGVLPPQGELYRLLDGRFTNPIPAREPGKAAVTTPVSVWIENGNANSKVIAAITPRRLWPL